MRCIAVEAACSRSFLSNDGVKDCGSLNSTGAVTILSIVSRDAFSAWRPGDTWKSGTLWYAPPSTACGSGPTAGGVGLPTTALTAATTGGFEVEAIGSFIVTGTFCFGAALFSFSTTASTCLVTFGGDSDDFGAANASSGTATATSFAMMLFKSEHIKYNNKGSRQRIRASDITCE